MEPSAVEEKADNMTEYTRNFSVDEGYLHKRRVVSLSSLNGQNVRNAPLFRCQVTIMESPLSEVSQDSDLSPRLRHTSANNPDSVSVNNRSKSDSAAMSRDVRKRHRVNTDYTPREGAGLTRNRSPNGVNNQRERVSSIASPTHPRNSLYRAAPQPEPQSFTNLVERETRRSLFQLFSLANAPFEIELKEIRRTTTAVYTPPAQVTVPHQQVPTQLIQQHQSSKEEEDDDDDVWSLSPSSLLLSFPSLLSLDPDTVDLFLTTPFSSLAYTRSLAMISTIDLLFLSSSLTSSSSIIMIVIIIFMLVSRLHLLISCHYLSSSAQDIHEAASSLTILLSSSSSSSLANRLSFILTCCYCCCNISDVSVQAVISLSLILRCILIILFASSSSSSAYSDGTNTNNSPMRARQVNKLLSTHSYVLTRDNHDASCCICLTSYCALDEVTSLPCPSSHVYHRACIEKWMLNRDVCPLCNFKLSQAD